MRILPGKTEAWKEFVRTLARQRLTEYEEARRRAGISKEMTWLQQTPEGDAVLVYWEAKNFEKTLEEFGNSQKPFDVWFRQMIRDIHGIDFTKPMTFPEMGYEWALKGFVVDKPKPK